MRWLDPVENFAGLLVIGALFLYGTRFLRRHARGEVPEHGGSWLFAGVVLVAIATGLVFFSGWEAAYGLWINLRAPSRLWSVPSIAVAGPEISMGETTTEVRSFRGTVELYAVAVSVVRDGNDLVVSAARLEALKRSPTFGTVEVYAARAQVYRRDRHHYTGRRGSGIAVDLRKITESRPVPVDLRLSNISPFGASKPVTITIAGAAKHCQPECGIGFSLALSSGEEANTTAIRVQYR